MNNELTLIIPAKNEPESLPKVLDELKNYEFNIKVILHKTDIKTIQAINDMNVEIIYQTNFGYGDALITGINNCTTKYFVFLMLMDHLTLQNLNICCLIL